MKYNSKIKILMIAAFGKGDDGMSFASCALRDKWIAEGLDVSCVDFFDNGGAGVGVSAINKIRSTFANKRIAKKLISGCDYVYFTPKLSPLGFISLIGYYKMCIEHDKPYTLHIHGRALIDTYKKHKWLRRSIVRYISKAKSNIALTERLKEEMQSLFKCGRFDVVGNFAPDDIMLKKEEKDRKLKIVQRKPIQICYLSNVIEAKGIFELMDAVGSDDKYVLKIAGRVFPEEQKRFDEYLLKYSNSEYLGFISSRQKRELLLNSAVLCLPSKYEAQPISIIEALCMGCIVIATELPGIADTLGEQYPHELYVKKDKDDIRRALGLLENPEKIYNRIIVNLEKYQQEFSLSKFAQKIYDCVTK